MSSNTNKKPRKKETEEELYLNSMPSIKFGYKVSRNILHSSGDTGSFNKTGHEVQTLFGNPPEEYWPYNRKFDKEVDEEPNAFSYALARNNRTVQCLRLDTPGISRKKFIETIKIYLCDKQYPGFTFKLFSSINQSINDGKVPYPCKDEKFLGYHYSTTIGYDDNLKIKNEDCTIETIGAFRILNTWGPNWGENGTGWLPYDYAQDRFVNDCWVTIKVLITDISIFKP